MTKCIPCAGFGVINDGPEPGPGRTCAVCGGSGLALMTVEYNPGPSRSWTWERLRDFFAGGGEISNPLDGGFERVIVGPAPSGKMETGDRPRIRWFAGIVGAPAGVRSLSREEIEAMNNAEARFREVRSRLLGGMPMQMGVDLARGQSETWHISWDPEGGKMVYRKLSPADMVRRDLAGEGSPDNGSD